MIGKMANEDITKNLDEFHYHEALDRLHVIISTCEDHLMQHPAIKLEPEVKQNIDKAIQHLCKAYQQIGNISDKIFNNE